MSQNEDFIESLKTDIQKGCGCKIYDKPLKDGGYHLRKGADVGGGLFVQIWYRKTQRDYLIQVKEKYAAKAGVSHLLADREMEKDAFGEPVLKWYIPENDQEKYRQVVGFLSRICGVR